MIYELAQWFVKKAKELWASIWIKGFFGKLVFFPINSILSILFLIIGLALYAASFMTILENIGRSMFFFFKRKVSYSGFLGKIVYFPLLLLSVAFCLGIIIFSIGQAMPFKQA
ncbi:MAG: hypothetical protein KAG56_09335 [Sulfurovaceae bacterium]|nr:hypothetical protein [Sulfurovaceae bacterium]